MKSVFKQEYLQMFYHKLNKYVPKLKPEGEWNEKVYQIFLLLIFMKIYINIKLH